MSAAPRPLNPNLGPAGAPFFDRELLERLERIEEKLDLLLAKACRGPAESALLAAIEETFGSGHFTAAGLLKLADEEPHSAIGDALAPALDWGAGAHARAVQLGMLLRRLPELEVAGETRGTCVYALRV